MAAGILANMEGVLGIHAWRWCVFFELLDFETYSSSIGCFSSRYGIFWVDLTVAETL
jgi:hypothetical protein